MLRSRSVTLVVLCIPLFVVGCNQNAISAWAQSPATTSPIQLIPRTKAQREQKYEAGHRISLIVQVTDSSGRPVPGLKAEDFSVLDNEKAQKIYRFREVDGKTFKSAVQVMIVLDGINDQGSAIGHVEKELGAILSHGTDPLPFPLSLVLLSSGGATRAEPSTNRALIAPKLKELAHRARDQDCPAMGTVDRGRGMRMFSSGAAIDQNKAKKTLEGCGFVQSINTLRALLGEYQKVRERTILVWTGRGWPVGGLYPGEYASAIAELNTDLREAQVTLDAISWSEFNRPPKFSKGVMSVTGFCPADCGRSRGGWIVAADSCATEWRAGVSQGEEFCKCDSHMYRGRKRFLRVEFRFDSFR